MKKFDLDTYTKRRIKELLGEKAYPQPPPAAVTRYTQQRQQEIKDTTHSEPALDKSPLGCYTVDTMGDRDGET